MGIAVILELNLSVYSSEKNILPVVSVYRNKMELCSCYQELLVRKSTLTYYNIIQYLIL